MKTRIPSLGREDPLEKEMAWCSDGKKSACKAGDLSLIPGSGRSPGEGNGNPLPIFLTENPMNRGVWWATVHEVEELDRTERLTCTSILAWEIPRTEEPSGLQSWGHERVRHNLVTKQLQFQEGRTKSNVMSPEWSAQLASGGAEWDSAGNGFFLTSWQNLIL